MRYNRDFDTTSRHTYCSVDSDFSCFVVSMQQGCDPARGGRGAARRDAARRGRIRCFCRKKAPREEKSRILWFERFFLSISDTFSQICEHNMLKMLWFSHDNRKSHSRSSLVVQTSKFSGIFFSVDYHAAKYGTRGAASPRAAAARRGRTPQKGAVSQHWCVTTRLVHNAAMSSENHDYVLITFLWV